MLTLGSQLLDATDSAIGVIQNAPDRWSVIADDVWRYLMPRFPYAIYYRVLLDHIRILAFKHNSYTQTTGATVFPIKSRMPIAEPDYQAQRA